MTPRRVLVTRPVREASRWVDALHARGFDAQCVPLIAIAPLEDSLALHGVRDRMASHDALMFVSAAAAEHFLAAMPPSTLPPRLRFWATGPGTAAALRAQGVLEAFIDMPAPSASQFDSEALWAVVQQQVGPSTRVLIVRGGDAQGRAQGREWLAEKISASGGRHDTVVAYRRCAPSWSDAQRQIAMDAASDGSVWIFSSSRAVANLRDALPQADWRAGRAVGTHARIAQAAVNAGFGTVRASNADIDALCASIESLG